MVLFEDSAALIGIVIAAAGTFAAVAFDAPVFDGVASILAAAANPASRANGVLTVQMAPDQILAALSLEFADDLRAPQIEDAVIAIERAVRAAHPEVMRLFVKPQTTATFRENAREQFG